MVYDTLPPPIAQALHECVARTIEAFLPDRLGEQCELLAYHYVATNHRR
jgi:hypothetical protein